jgi:hypothetical protein
MVPVVDEKKITRSSYSGLINQEGILVAHINHMSVYRDSNINQYASSIETFIIMCPKNIRDEAMKKLTVLGLKRGGCMKISDKDQLAYDDLWIFTNELLEKNNLIFRTGTFEIGHD